MTHQYHIPTALFLGEQTIYGMVYHPANQNAKDMCRIAGVVRMPEDRMPYVRRFCQVLATNGKPIPYPKGYQRPVEPQHILDEA